VGGGELGKNSHSAIHLSSAMIWAENFNKKPIFLTHDQQLGKAALINGFSVVGC
jgi:hypothetical protein